MAAPARTAFWRMTLQANASSSGCGAISINLERISNVGAVKVRNDTLVNRRETKTVGNSIQLSTEVLPLGWSEMANGMSSGKMATQVRVSMQRWIVLSAINPRRMRSLVNVSIMG